MKKLAAIFWVCSCAPLPILAPTFDAHGCNQDTEHYCDVGGGCCLDGWTCGGEQPGQPNTCPDGVCCDNEENPPMVSAKAPKHKRYP